MTVTEIATAIVTKLDRSTDEGLLNAIKLSVQGKWALAVKREYETKGKDSNIYEQTIEVTLGTGAVELQCGTAPEDVCLVLKSTSPLPAYLPIVGREPYRVTTPDRKTVLEYIRPEHYIYTNNARYTGKSMWYTLINQYLYVYGSLTLEKVHVTFIPDSPDGLDDFDCLTCGSEGIIPSWMEDMITKQVRDDLRGLQGDRDKEEIDERSNN